MKKNYLINQIQHKKSFLCVGLDTDITKIPKHLLGHSDPMFEFNKIIIDTTKDFCVSYKINTAFYESMGLKGWETMEKTLHYIPNTHFKIADAKRGDIGNTSKQYAKTFFETLPFDAITINPYMGEDSVRPFLEYENKWSIVLGLTSNLGANDIQKLNVDNTPLYKNVIKNISNWGNEDNLMFVVGATKANELKEIREIIPNNFILVPGIGAQGGNLEEVCNYGLNKDYGLLLNISRDIIYSSDKEDFSKKSLDRVLWYKSQIEKYFS